MIRKLLLLGRWALVFAFVSLLPDGANAQVGHNDFQNCSFCHLLHGQSGGFLLKEADVELLCLSCHLEGNSGSTLKADVHKNEPATSFAPFYITCLRCHNPHDNMANWVPGHVDDVSPVPAGLVEGTNAKLIGRPYPGAPSVSNGRTFPLASGVITAVQIVLPDVVGGLTFIQERPLPVGPLNPGFSFEDGGNTNDDRIVRSGGSWIADGYQIGDAVTILGAEDSENDGTFVVRDLTASTLFIPSPSVRTLNVDDASATVDGANTDAEIQRATGSWITDGYLAGTRITVSSSGVGCLDGTYTVTGVSDSTLFLDPGSLMNHGRAGPDPQPTTSKRGERNTGFDFVIGTVDPLDSCPDGNDCVVRNDGRSWIDVGYRADCQFTITGASNGANDGTFTLLTPSTGPVWRDTLTVTTGSFCGGNCGRNDSDDTSAELSVDQLAVDPGVTAGGVINAYSFDSAFVPSKWFVLGQGIVVTGFANVDNNGFAVVESVDDAAVPPRIVVRPYRIDPAANLCGSSGGTGFERPCQLLPIPSLVDEAGTGIQIRSSATYLSVTLNADSNFDGTLAPIPDNDPDGEQLVALLVDFVDGDPGADSIARLDGASWIQDGYRVGLKFPVTGATNPANNGTFTVASVSDLSLTVEEQLTADTVNLVTIGGTQTADLNCLTAGAAEVNCCYTSGRRQVVFEHNEPGPILHAFADEDRDTLAGPDRLSPDWLLRRGTLGAGGQEFSTGRWDGGCGEACHSLAGNHRKDCAEDGGLTGECDTGGAFGHDDHNSDANCTQCHGHADGFARGNLSGVTLTANSCRLN